MKVIDLLNKIANGEDVPKKIKYKDFIYEYYEKETITDYRCYDEKTELYGYLSSCVDYETFNILDNEVEIIEEEKKIPEKLEDRAGFQYSQIPSWFYGKELIKTINENFEKHQKAIYEIIDYLDYLKSKGE